MELDNANTAVHDDRDKDTLLENHLEVPKPVEKDSISEPSVPAATSTAQVDPVEPETPSPGLPPPESPKLTSALEALIGGLDTPSQPAAEAPLTTAAPEPADIDKVAPIESKLLDVQNAPADIDPGNSKEPEAKIGSLVKQLAPEASASQEVSRGDAPPIIEGIAGENEHPEWEVDSSPIESSSDDSSSDDSSSDDESEEGDNAYKLLSPEEQARILMEEGGGSDDEGGKKGAKGTGAQLRTKNEIPEVVISKPDVTITEEMPIEELGDVEAIVDNILLIKANTSGEYRVLESGSVLCLADRSVIGAVSETLGRVQQPLYSVLFTNAEEVTNTGLSVGTKVFYSAKHSTYVFTQALKAYKGSDASNLHDEEVGVDEMEFSDDEAEMEHKRKVKQQKLERRGGKTQQNNGPRRGGHPLQQHHAPYDASTGVSYDDVEEDDGPYKPLSRPVGYADSVGHSEAPHEDPYQAGANGYLHNQSRDQFRGRGRGDRGRGRGDRGRGRAGHSDRRGSGHSLPQSRPSYPPLTQSPKTSFPQPSFQPQRIPFPGPTPEVPRNPSAMSAASYSNMEYSPHQPQLPTWPQFPSQLPYPSQPLQQSFPNMQNNWPANPAGVSPGGTFINPAFFNNAQGGAPTQWSYQEQQNGRGRGSS